MIPVFITGTGTGVGKTIVSAIVSNALDCDYWKPVQSGNIEGTDRELVLQFMPAGKKCFEEAYNLSEPASPHLAAKHENKNIDLDVINQKFERIGNQLKGDDYLVIEGAGGLLVPLNDSEFVCDLIAKLGAKVILVSRNYLGSINHSLLTAEVCRQKKLDVIGWIFNDEFMHYQDEIASWSGYPVIGSIPKLDTIDKATLVHHSAVLRKKLLQLLQTSGS